MTDGPRDQQERAAAALRAGLSLAHRADGGLVRMRRLFGWRDSSITRKLILAFVAVFGLAVAVLGTLSIRIQSDALSEALGKKAEILARNLATAVGEPLFLGDLDRVGQLIAAANRVDDDVVYVVVVGTDGRVLARTGSREAPAAVGSTLSTVTGVTDFARRDTDSSRTFEVVMPVNPQGVRAGVLVIGVSTHQVQATARRAGWAIFAVGGLGLTLGALSYVYIARRVTRPLLAVVQRLGELAAGHADLTLRLEVRTDDELGQLGRALNTFLDKLHHLVAEIRQTSGQVGAASHQISRASTHLSERAQAQASSLEETAASLEEITGTVKQTADNARRANELAGSSRTAAERGGQVVSAAVASMNEITEASQKIAAITTVIDEIAFQTNLLALNAAVEAARAGEQGRGFAVVAAEVRNLAQRSAAAAKQITALIRDSADKVEEGAGLVNQSGETLADIVAAVKRVSGLIAEMAGASEEQAQGIDQVNHAVGRMDVVVQENAGQTEELSATARTLAAQAEQLQALVGRFVLERRPAAAAPRTAAPAPVGAIVARPTPASEDIHPRLVGAGAGPGRGIHDRFERS
jgi:methyl-accepting chemotaxis protein